MRPGLRALLRRNVEAKARIGKWFRSFQDDLVPQDALSFLKSFASIAVSLHVQLPFVGRHIILLLQSYYFSAHEFLLMCYDNELYVELPCQLEQHRAYGWTVFCGQLTKGFIHHQ